MFKINLYVEHFWLNVNKVRKPFAGTNVENELGGLNILCQVSNNITVSQIKVHNARVLKNKILRRVQITTYFSQGGGGKGI